MEGNTLQRNQAEEIDTFSTNRSIYVGHSIASHSHSPFQFNKEFSIPVHSSALKSCCNKETMDSNGAESSPKILRLRSGRVSLLQTNMKPANKLMVVLVCLMIVLLWLWLWLWLWIGRDAGILLYFATTILRERMTITMTMTMQNLAMSEGRNVRRQ